MTCGCNGKITYGGKAKTSKKPKTKSTGKVPAQFVKAPTSTKPKTSLPKQISRGSEYGRVMYQI